MRFRGDGHANGDRFEPHDPPEFGPDPEFQAELVRRLRAMEWPAPPAGAKERCLRAVMERIAEQAQNGSAPEPGRKREALRARGRDGEEYSLTRRALDHQRDGVALRRRPLDLRRPALVPRRSPLATPRQAIRLGAAL